MDYLVERALDLLRSRQEYAEDAREGAAVGNTLAGSILSLTAKAPRQHAEAAVQEALLLLNPRAGRSRRRRSAA